MFDDEIPEETKMLVSKEEFQVLVDHHFKETGKNWSEEEMDQIFKHLEELFFSLNLYDMAAQGILIMNYDERNKRIIYTATKDAEIKARQYKKAQDLISIDNLLENLDDGNNTIH